MRAQRRVARPAVSRPTASPEPSRESLRPRKVVRVCGPRAPPGSHATVQRTHEPSHQFSPRRWNGGPLWAPIRTSRLLWTEVAARIQEPVVLGRPARSRIRRSLVDADVNRRLQAVELVERPDAAGSVDRCAAGPAVADARRARAARVERVGDPW